MSPHIPILLLAILSLLFPLPPVLACCPVSPGLEPIVNADQTGILRWDAKTKTQHFIRQASFKTQSPDLGFIVPTPSQPQLSESGDAAFTFLDTVTERPIVEKPTPWHIPIGCAAAPKDDMEPVRVLEEKRVAGFDAVVLEADSAAALKSWLADHNYAFSPQVEAWAAPYIATGWKFTAMKVAKDKADPNAESITASALRLSFKTDRPLFPYREPDPESAARALGAYDRLLKIYFIAEARYQGELPSSNPQASKWTGKTTFAKPLVLDQLQGLVARLKLPDNTSLPASAWLTVFEDHWPYRVAPADLYFSPESTQQIVPPFPRIRYVSRNTDPTFFVILGTLAVVPFIRHIRSTRRNKASA